MADEAKKDEHEDKLVGEFTSDKQGGLSPFGDVEFPLPADKVMYAHPRPEDRPHRAGA